MTQAKHVFLMRILDSMGAPTEMRIVKSPEEGEAIYQTMLNERSFLEDEVEFEISQGATIINTYVIPSEEGETY